MSNKQEAELSCTCLSRDRRFTLHGHLANHVVRKYEKQPGETETDMDKRLATAARNHARYLQGRQRQRQLGNVDRRTGELFYSDVITMGALVQARHLGLAGSYPAD